MGCGGAKPPPASQGAKAAKDGKNGKADKPEHATIELEINDGTGTQSLMMSEASSGPAPPDPAQLLYAKIEAGSHVFIHPHDVCVFGSTSRPSSQAQPSDPGIDRSTPCHSRIELEHAEKDIEFSSRSGIKDVSTLHEQLATDGIGFTCRKARKPKVSNQDNIVFLQANGFTVASVIDGHGDSGHWVSHWAARYVAAQMLEEVCGQGKVPPITLWQKIFNCTHEALELRAADEDFDVRASGATVTIVVVDHKAGTFEVGWAGDSCCVYGSNGGSSAKKMTLEHKPEKSDERVRIFGAGGHVKRDGSGCQRVSALTCNDPDIGLAVTRAIGDTMLHQVGVIHLPGTNSLVFGTDETPFIIVASDGLWDMVEEQEACQLVGKLGCTKAGEAVETLAKLSKERWVGKCQADQDTDDISIIVVWLRKT